MESSNLAEITAAQYQANRAHLQTQQARINCQLQLTSAQIAAEETRLAVLRCQQEQVQLLIDLSHSNPK